MGLMLAKKLKLVQKVYPIEEKNDEEKPSEKADNAAVNAAQAPQPAQNDEELGQNNV